MTFNELAITIGIGLVTAAAIVLLGVLDVLTLTLFLLVLAAGGFASAIATISSPTASAPQGVEAEDSPRGTQAMGA